MPINRKKLAIFQSLSDNLTNNERDFYKIPESKLEELSGIYNKDKMILLSWDDRHRRMDISCLNMDVDKKVMERILKLTKMFGNEDIDQDV